jgi:hypothetical protein
MEMKADLYRAKAARCEVRAKNKRHKNARERQLTLARVYQVLATEAEIAVQQGTQSDSCPFAYWSNGLVP